MSPVNHTDFATPIDGPEHLDLAEHVDAAHVDTSRPSGGEVEKHTDYSHADMPHGDVAHGDHQDWIHDDSKHGDIPHWDQSHEDHTDNSRPVAGLEVLFEQFLRRTEELIQRLEHHFEQQLGERVTAVTADANRAFEELGSRVATLEERVEALERGDSGP